MFPILCSPTGLYIRWRGPAGTDSPPPLFGWEGRYRAPKITELASREVRWNMWFCCSATKRSSSSWLWVIQWGLLLQWCWSIGFILHLSTEEKHSNVITCVCVCLWFILNLFPSVLLPWGSSPFTWKFLCIVCYSIVWLLAHCSFVMSILKRRENSVIIHEHPVLSCTCVVS